MRILTGLTTVAVVVATVALAPSSPATAATGSAPTTAATGSAPATAATGTAYTWVGGDGAWTDAGNWSPHGVPGAGDGATVLAATDASCHAHVTQVPAGLSLADLTVDEHLYRGDPDSPCLTSIDDGSITVTHQFTFHAGTIGTDVTIASGASGVITPGAAHDTTHLSGAVTVRGGLTLANTTGAESLSLTDASGITVASGGTLTTQGDNHLGANCCLSPAHVTNNGTIALGGGTTTLDAVELDQNALLNATGGATLLTDFAPQTAGAGARWTGDGAWRLGYSSVTTVSGVQSLGSDFSWQLGGNGSTAQEFLQGTFSLAGTGRFLWNGGQIGAAMTISSGIRFVAAGVDGVDPREISGVGPSGSAVAVSNRGTMTFSGGAGWYGVNGSRVVNGPTGVLTLGAGTAIGADCCNTPSSLVNSGGHVVVPASAGKIVVDDTGYRATGGSLFVGSGSDLELTGGAPGLLSSTTITGGGTLGLAQAVTTAGTDTVDTGTTLTLEKSGAVSTTGSATTTIGGAGSFAWTGGSVTGALTVTTSTGQTVSGSTDTKHILVPTGSKGSTVTFAGPTTLVAGTAKAPDVLQSDNGTKLAFTGALSWQGYTQLSGGAITTSGVTTVAAGSGTAALASPAVLTDTGALTVATGTLASDNDIRQTAGSTTIAAGATVTIVGSSSVLRVSGGTLAGSGQVTGNVVLGSATLAPGSSGTGTLTVTGTFTAASGATLQFELASGARDVLAVGGTATLHGTLRLVDLGNYQPVTGETATVVTAGQLAASFACTTTTGDGAATQHWTARVIGRNALRLTSNPGAPVSC